MLGCVARVRAPRDLAERVTAKMQRLVVAAEAQRALMAAPPCFPVAPDIKAFFVVDIL